MSYGRLHEVFFYFLPPQIKMVFSLNEHIYGVLIDRSLCFANQISYFHKLQGKRIVESETPMAYKTHNFLFSLTSPLFLPLMDEDSKVRKCSSCKILLPSHLFKHENSLSYYRTCLPCRYKKRLKYYCTRDVVLMTYSHSFQHSFIQARSLGYDSGRGWQPI